MLASAPTVQSHRFGYSTIKYLRTISHGICFTAGYTTPTPPAFFSHQKRWAAPDLQRLRKRTKRDTSPFYPRLRATYHGEDHYISRFLFTRNWPRELPTSISEATHALLRINHSRSGSLLVVSPHIAQESIHNFKTTKRSSKYAANRKMIQLNNSNGSN